MSTVQHMLVRVFRKHATGMAGERIVTRGAASSTGKVCGYVDVIAVEG